MLNWIGEINNQNESNPSIEINQIALEIMSQHLYPPKQTKFKTKPPHNKIYVEDQILQLQENQPKIHKKYIKRKSYGTAELSGLQSSQSLIKKIKKQNLIIFPTAKNQSGIMTIKYW